MKLADTLAFGAFSWTAREFSGAEHQLMDEVAQRHGLDELTAKFAAHRPRESARLELLNDEIKHLERRLEIYKKRRNAGQLKDGERIRAYEAVSELEMLQEQAGALEEEIVAEGLLRQEEYLALRDAAYAEMLHAPLKRDGYEGTVEELFDELQETPFSAEEVLGLGKAPLPLSGLRREQKRRLASSQPDLTGAVAKLLTGIASASTPKQQE